MLKGKPIHNGHITHEPDCCPHSAQQRFEDRRAGQDYAWGVKARAAIWRSAGSKNPLLRLLLDIWVATADPAFERAFTALQAYGCANPRQHPGKRIKALQNALQHNGALPGCVEVELARQAKAGKTPSVKAACRAVAASCAYGPSFEATVKRVERIYREYKRNGYLLGDTGRMLYIAQISCPEDATEAVICNMEFAPDNRLVRQALNEQKYILLATLASNDEEKRLQEAHDRSGRPSRINGKKVVWLEGSPSLVAANEALLRAKWDAEDMKLVPKKKGLKAGTRS